MPERFSLPSQGLLPKGFVIVASTLRDKNDGAYRKEAQEAMKEFAPKLTSEGAAGEHFDERLFADG